MKNFTTCCAENVRVVEKHIYKRTIVTSRLTTAPLLIVVA